MPFRRRVIGLLVLLSATVAAAPSSAAAAAAFRDVPRTALPSRLARPYDAPLPQRFRALAVDLVALSAELARAPQERAGGHPLELALPYPDGSNPRFAVVASSILEPALQAKFPELRTYLAQGLDDPTATARLSLTPLGFHAQILAASGTVYVDPYRRGEPRFAIAYLKRDARRAPGAPFHCDVDEDVAPVAPALDSVGAAASGANLRTYRLALAATGEYSTAVCAPNPAAVACAMAAMVVSMNRVDGIYEREVAIRMVLIANDNLIVYTDGTTDPYTNNDGATMLTQNRNNLNTVIGSANFDIGHVFSTGGGGIASLRVPCTSSKAQGVTGSSHPVGDGFDVDYVAHEMGHQFGGNHTFNGTTGNCGGGNRSGSAAYEPGSGTTIMAYAGICGAEDLQPHSDDTFHTKSFDEIVAFSTGVTGSSCAVVTATGNQAPSVNAGDAFTIPKQTPFTLTGSATDPDGDALTYLWEEFDLGSAAPPNDDVAAARPIFRSFVPLPVPSRTFPRLSDVLGNVATLGESLPARNRTLSFRLTARDNRSGGGGVSYASTSVTVNAAAGPFLVTQPNTALTWAANSSQTVTWNVAGTTAAPISCANVAIDLSTDGGDSFPTVLTASTPNDGAETVTIPNQQTTTARVRVACVGNVFFDLSNVNFTIGAPSALPPPSLASILPTSGPAGGGTVVSLTGTDFASGATVLFGAQAATGVTFNSSTSLSATAPAGTGTVAVTVTNPDTQSSTLPLAFTFVPPGFYTLTPCRAVDTRSASGPLGGPALAAGVIRNFAIAGTCGVPADAIAVALNVTIVSPTAAGSLNLFPTGVATPNTSTIAFAAGQTRANNALTGVFGPTTGSVSALATMVGGGTVHLIVDVTGYFR